MATSKTRTIRFRCTPEEEAELKRRADLQRISISDLMRQKLDLDASQPRTYAGKPVAVDPAPSTWKDLLPPT